MLTGGDNLSNHAHKPFSSAPKRATGPFTRAAAICAALSLAVAAICGCGGPSVKDLEDGVYTGVSGEDDDGAYGEVTITIKDGAVESCEFVTWQSDGSAKGEDYGKVNGEISNQEFYDKAPLAVKALRQYADDFVETQDVAGIDAVSGATVSYGQFRDAVGDALAAAAE
jgi:major membrane immunogen (membrane-anchored lipoprotein)